MPTIEHIIETAINIVSQRLPNLRLATDDLSWHCP